MGKREIRVLLLVIWRRALLGLMWKESLLELGLVYFSRNLSLISFTKIFHIEDVEADIIFFHSRSAAAWFHTIVHTQSSCFSWFLCRSQSLELKSLATDGRVICRWVLLLILLRLTVTRIPFFWSKLFDTPTGKEHQIISWAAATAFVVCTYSPLLLEFPSLKW